MRSHVAILLALLASALNSYAYAPRPFNPQDQTRGRTVERSLELLDEAHRLSDTFGVEQRAWIVFEAAEVAAPVDAARGKRWALEVWRLSRQLERGQNRVALQKNSLRTLAVNDSELALRLYRRQDLPATWDAVHNVTEDARALGYSNTFFKPVWEKGGAAYRSKLQHLARFLGSTGQYPYAAMSKIALDVAEHDPRAAASISHDAVKYFRRDPGFASTNSEFVRFILGTRKIAPPQVLRQELIVATTALQQPPRAFRNQTWQIVATTPVGSATFDSQNESLLFRLFPLVKASLPETADGLLSRYESLRKAPAITVDTPVNMAGSVSFAGDATPARMQSKLDESLAYKVQMSAASDPQQALTLANQISDADLRALALVSLAPAYFKIDAKSADTWISDAQSHFSTVNDESKKIRLMVEVARAQISLGREPEAAALIPRIFDAEEVAFAGYATAHPSELADSAPGYDALSNLTSTVVKTNDRTVVARVEEVKSDVLRAELLISSAKGMLEKQ